jgi:hypothetical protein
MYLASIVDKAIVGCCLLLQEMAPPPIMNTNLVVDPQGHRLNPHHNIQPNLGVVILQSVI